MSEQRQLAVYTHLKPEEYRIWSSCREQIAALRQLKNKLTQRAINRRWNGTHIRPKYQSPHDMKIARAIEKMAADKAEYLYKKENGLLEPPTFETSNMFR